MSRFTLTFGHSSNAASATSLASSVEVYLCSPLRLTFIAKLVGSFFPSIKSQMDLKISSFLSDNEKETASFLPEDSLKLKSTPMALKKESTQIRKSGNLELKNIVKLKAMSNNDILLSTYNVPFYKPKNIYLDQIDISDDREIYANVNLNKYIADDPIAIRANKINELQIERQQLLIQLEVLKNG